MDCAHGNPMALLSSVRFSSESLDLKMDLGTQECTPAHIEDMSWGQAIPAPSSLVSKVFFFFLFAEDASDPWSMNTVWICIHVVWGSQESHQRRLKINELRIQLKKLEKEQQKSEEYRKKEANKKIRIK